jgi:hypothetical protein
MTPSEDEIAGYLNQAAALLGLPIRPEHYDEVLAVFRAARGGSPPRRLRATQIISFGQGYAVATTNFYARESAKWGGKVRSG